jgi:hypothetical protein
VGEEVGGGSRIMVGAITGPRQNQQGRRHSVTGIRCWFLVRLEWRLPDGTDERSSQG